MRRLILAVLLVAGLNLAFGLKTEAADPPLPGQPRPDQFPGLNIWNLAESELLRFGVFRYRLEDSCSPKSAQAVREAMNSISRESGALFLESANGWRIRVLCGVEWTAAAGATPGVIGCLCEGFPGNVNIVLNGSMEGWSFDISRLAVALHELMHALLTWNEQYGANLGAVPGWRDFMNTGPDSRHDFEYVEIQRLERTAIPQAHNGGALLGDVLVYGSSDRQTTRIAVFFRTYTGYVFFSGQYLTPIQCSGLACGAERIQNLGPCTAVLLGHENALPLSWGRELVDAGTTSCL